MTAAPIRFVPTTRPPKTEETVLEGLDRVASALLELSGDVAELRRRVTAPDNVRTLPDRQDTST